jgi:hypothetical protein
MAHTRSSTRTASVGRLARFASIGVDAGLQIGARGQPPAIRPCRSCDDLFFHRSQRAEELPGTREGVAGRRPDTHIAPTGGPRSLRSTQQGVGAARQGRGRCASVVAGSGSVPVGREGNCARDRLTRCRRRCRRLVGFGGERLLEVGQRATRARYWPRRFTQWCRTNGSAISRSANDESAQPDRRSPGPRPRAAS